MLISYNIQKSDRNVPNFRYKIRKYSVNFLRIVARETPIEDSPRMWQNSVTRMEFRQKICEYSENFQLILLCRKSFKILSKLRKVSYKHSAWFTQIIVEKQLFALSIIKLMKIEIKMFSPWWKCFNEWHFPRWMNKYSIHHLTLSGEFQKADWQLKRRLNRNIRL